MRLADFEAVLELPPEVARDVTYIVWSKRALRLGHMPEDAPDWVREHWEAERAKIEAIAVPLAMGAREFQDRMIADILKGNP